MAAMEGESSVETALQLLLEMQSIPTQEAVKELLTVKNTVPNIVVAAPDLTFYDGLLNHSNSGVLQ